MQFDIQPRLENNKVLLYPLEIKDFGVLYDVASNPEIWEQHPSKDRWKIDVFRIFFKEAIESKGAFKIIDKATGSVIGSTRFYNYNEKDNSMFIGYTFYDPSYWGKGFNRSVKTTMLDYVFQFVAVIYFHVGAGNIRSRIAIERIGAERIAESKAITDETQRFVYRITKEKWYFRDLAGGRAKRP